jgi:hypothetical protein
VFEVADEFVLFYTCLRKHGTTEFPARTENAEGLLKMKHTYQFAMFFIATIEVWTE